MLQRFWQQPSRAYRNFQIVYTAITLNFLIPSLGYLADPEGSIRQFDQVGRLMGGIPYPVSEQSIIWQVLGATNVLTLAFCCLLLQLDLRRFYPVLWPLTFLKGSTSLTFLQAYLFRLHHPLLLGAFLLDGVTLLCFVFFARSAARDVWGRPDSELVPRPLLGGSPIPGGP